jgi:hypothetical protein
MVNGYLQSSIRAEDFAGCSQSSGRFCLPNDTGATSYTFVMT